MSAGVGGVQRPQDERPGEPEWKSCDHYWAFEGQADFPPKFMLRRCMICNHVDGAEITAFAAAVEVLAYERAAETIQAEMQRCPPQENNGFDEAWHDGLGEAVRLVRGLAASPVVVSPVEEGKQR